MQLYKLTPIDLTDPGWRASRHKGEVIVRAASEAAARARVDRRFGTGIGREDLSAAVRAPLRAGAVPKDERLAGAVKSPWQNKLLVRCEPASDPRFDQDGPELILDPADYDLPGYD